VVFVIGYVYVLFGRRRRNVKSRVIVVR